MELNSILPQGSVSHAANRITTYGSIASELSLLSNKRISELLLQASLIGTSIGGTTVLLNMNGTKIFVKKIPLTDIEKQPENFMSTANLFGLPSYCQYGLGEGPVGSPGFGVWRELAANIMSTNWVLTGECPNFPILYHWRMLPKLTSEPTHQALEELERNVEFWEGAVAVRSRLEANLRASSEIVLFFEYIPETVDNWFSKQVAIGGVPFESASKMVKSELQSATSFMNSRGLLHFDAHFRNILTDGTRLYFSDFGLATCSSFELSKSELEFFETHCTYDRCYTVTHFVNWLSTKLFGRENREEFLRNFANGKEVGELTPFLASIIKRDAPLAVLMNDFYRRFLTESRQAEYPAIESKRLCESVRNI